MTAKELREKARDVIAAALAAKNATADSREAQIAIDVLRLGVVIGIDGKELD